MDGLKAVGPSLCGLLGATPFGVYCRKCNHPLGTRDIANHARDRHGVRMDTGAHAEVRKVKALAKQLGQEKDRSKYLTRVYKKGYVCSCGKVLASYNGLKYHASQKKHVIPRASKCELQMTTCGRYVHNAIKEDCHATRAKQIADAREIITGYTRPDEDAETWLRYLEPLTHLSWASSFDDTIRQMIGWWDDSVDEEAEVGLKLLMDAAESWLFEVARVDSGQIPPIWRAKLVVFEGQERDEVSQNFVYNFRYYEENMWPELRKLLCFVWRYPHSDILKGLRHIPTTNDTTLWAPRILFTLLSEQAKMVTDIPLVSIYCLSRAFRFTKGDVTMKSCGTVASDVATIMSLMRAGVCSVWRTMSVDRLEKSLPIVTRSLPISRLASMVRGFREMQRRKPQYRKKTVSPEGDIAVDGFLFPKKTWSNLILLTVDSCKALLAQLIGGQDWLAVLDVHNQIVVERKSVSEPYHFKLDALSIDYSKLALSVTYDDATMDALTSYVELCFHGFGGGSMRMEELFALDLSHCLWHRGTIYYTATSIKQFSLKKGSSSSRMQVERKLPVVLARVFLLYRLLAHRISPRSGRLIVYRNNRLHTANDAVAELFSFSSRPSMLHVRHLWTSIGNFIFPTSNDGLISANEECALMSSHSVTTHARKYGSKVIGASELFYRKTHEAMGDRVFTGDGKDSLVESDLDRAMTWMFGSQARYTSDLQQSSVVSSLSDRDVLITAGCGSGKSLSWLLPSLAAKGLGKKFGMMIVALPYNFLVRTHFETAESLSKQFGLRVCELYSRDVWGDYLPAALQDEDNLPHLLFISLDALVTLMKYQGAIISQWCLDGVLQRIFLDEIHTIFFESFRNIYEQLKQVGGFRCPVTALSGSLPKEVGPDLFKYLGLSPSATKIHCQDLFGNLGTCALTVSKTNNLLPAGLSCIRKHQTQSIHVICSSKACAQSIYEKLNASSTELITSDTDLSEQLLVASKWKASEFDILVSTTCCLVGNENSQCRVVLLLGNIYNLANVVQGIGRLRPKQRVGAHVYVILQEKIFPDQLQHDELMIQSLVHRGLLSETNARAFGGMGTCMSLHCWLADKCCRFVSLAHRLGYKQKDCGQCDVCLSRKKPSCLEVRSEVAAIGLSADADLKNKAARVLGIMEGKCLVCGRDSCDGEKCLGGGCFACGGSHMRKNCPADMYQLLRGRGCTGCFLLLGDIPQQQLHRDKRACPTKRRFNRMLIQHYRESQSKQPLHQFVMPILAENAKMYQFIVQFSDKLAQGK